jgi:Kef-type K+ transport system membrane component KefB/nucleotide-binding universal stress UspA family protein
LWIIAAALVATAIASPSLAEMPGQAKGASEVIFIVQIVALMVVGRLLGELMLRWGQPAVMGQLVAGLLLGPSFFGLIAPDWQHALFPKTPEQKAMIDGVAQFGILLLLLLTGMETDLKLVRQTGRASIYASVMGIIVPFACGVALGEMLPDSMLPDPEKRLITSLFLGTALAIASVKIVAVVIREMNFMRRVVGQVILASAIIDDSIGWIIVSIIFSLALHGAIEPLSVAQSVIGTILFMVASFTIGRRMVFFAIRWVNDNFVSEFAVITTIMVIMSIMALITYLIGVHTVLGAFVAGILVGESPILTKHIDEQVRGLITAFFAPVFFGIAGLSADLSILADPHMALLTAGLIVIASVGKFGGAFIGAELGGLTRREGFALACGMNARGSTEVIIATVGLSMGALNQNLFTMIVAMAVITTMAMPPTLRWALSRIPMRKEERLRLEREDMDTRGFVPNLERLLVAIDDSANGKFATRVGGIIAGHSAMPTTVMHIRPPNKKGGKAAAATAEEKVKETAETVQVVAERTEGEENKAGDTLDISTVVEIAPTREQIAEEAQKGYDLMLVGLEKSVVRKNEFSNDITNLAAGFEGPLAVVDARGEHLKDPLRGRLSILVPVNGTDVSRRAAEVAIAIARATGAPITALYVAQTGKIKTKRSRQYEEAILKDIVKLADTYEVDIKTAVRPNVAADQAIVREIHRRRNNLVVMGVGRRPGERLYFGDTAATLLETSDRSLMFVAS